MHRQRSKLQTAGAFLACLSLGGLVGCGSSAPAPPPSTPSTPAGGTPAPGGAAAPTGSPLDSLDAAQTLGVEDSADTYEYNPVGKRDPFKTFYADYEAMLRVKRTPRTPLERFDISQLKLIAIITGLAQPRAMVEAPDGKGYSLRRGTAIGLNGGRVSRITRDEVIVTEEFRDPAGRRQQNTVRIRMPGATGFEGLLSGEETP